MCYDTRNYFIESAGYPGFWALLYVATPSE